MKKTVLLISILLVSALGAASQDTLVSAYPKAGYFYNGWLDSGGIDLSNFPMFDGPYLTAKYCEADKGDTLQVYGIAASLFPRTWGVRDLSNYKEAYDYLCLYKTVADTLQAISDSLLVHLQNTPIDYYFYLDQPLYYYNLTTNHSYPVYERYFDAPVAVTDSFYVGLTGRSWEPEIYTSGPDSGWYSGWVAHPGVMLNAYCWPDLFPPIKIMLARYWPPDPSFGINEYTLRWTFYDLSGPMQGMMGFPYPFIFPILTPPDSTHLNPVDTTHVDTTVVDTTVVDTTIVDTTVVDTVGIAQRLLERYTGLQPNPAAERVQVLSSFGLTGVEVYNAAGIKVQEQKATGYVATLDVGALPAGPYLVRIKTPNGTVTKKLLVQRR